MQCDDIQDLDGEHPLLSFIQLGPAWLDTASFKPLLMRIEGSDGNILKGFAGAVQLPDGRILIYRQNLGLARITPTGDQGLWKVDGRWYLPDRPQFTDGALDGRGRVWLSSDRGGFLLDPTTNALCRIDALHGAPGLISGRLTRQANGDLLVGEWGGFRIPREFEPSTDEPLLMIREVKINGATIALDTALSRGVQVTYDRNDLSLTFGTVALLEGNVFEYAYRVVRDSEAGAWIDLGTQRNLNLAGLSPGNYRVELRSTGPAGPPVLAELDLIIVPPWWATWWARAIIVMLAVSCIILLTRYIITMRLRQRLRAVEREREVERVRLRIARDVHDGIGSGLTKITMMSRQLEGAAGAQAAHIAKAAGDLVKELGEIVWTVDPRNDSYASFVAYVRNMLGRWSEEIAVPLSADLRFDPAHGDRIIGPEVKRNVLLVLKEAVNNALKHSGASHIQVKLDLAREHVHLEVSDNGNGFDPANIREGGNGLVNFRKRAELIQGTCELHSGPTGTRVILDVPLIPTNM
jgi:signal transduction histidine kinase